VAEPAWRHVSALVLPRGARHHARINAFSQSGWRRVIDARLASVRSAALAAFRQGTGAMLKGQPLS
jgi:hypothetical protein